MQTVASTVYRLVVNFIRAIEGYESHTSTLHSKSVDLDIAPSLKGELVPLCLIVIYLATIVSLARGVSILLDHIDEVLVRVDGISTELVNVVIRDYDRGGLDELIALEVV